MKAVISFFFIALTAAAWEPLAPLPKANGGFASGFVDGKLVIAGGTNWTDGTKHWLKSIWNYDSATNAWSEIGELPESRAYAGSGVVHGHLVILGGSDGTKALPSAVAISGAGKVRTIGSIEHPTIYSCSGSSGEMLFVAGGSSDPADLSTFSNKICGYRFDAALTSVSTLFTHQLEGPGFGTGTLAFGKDAYIFGGAVHDAAAVVANRDWIYSINDQAVSASKTKLPHPIRGITAVTLNERFIYLGGGYPSDEVGFTADAYLFDTLSQSLQPATKLPIAAMVHLASDGRHLYCLGGEDAKKHRSDKMWRIPLAEVLNASK